MFYELIRFNAPDPAGVRRATRPRELDALDADRPRARQPGRARAVFGGAAGVPRDPPRRRSRPVRAVQRPPVGVGRGESSSSAAASGPWRALLEELGAWDPAWAAAWRSAGAVSRRERLSRRARARRARRADDARRISTRLAARGATLVTCPRSNGHTGAGAPPLEDFYASGVRVAVGTDSLASTPDLNVFAELATMRALAPSVPAARAARQRDAAGRARARLRRRLRHDRAGQARAAAGRRRSGAASTMWKNIWCRRRSQPRRRSRLDWTRDDRDRAVESAMIATLATYLSFVRFSHSVFALPFALAGALLACACRRPDDTWATRRLWILVAMVAARSAAMGFNRLVDARFDALNPRTANRELPRGAMSTREAALFVAVASAVVRLRGVAAEPDLLRAVAGRAGDRVLVLAGQALHHLDAAVPRPGDGGRAGRRLAGGRRPRRLGAVAAGARRSARGSAASTCSTPARISTSIARTGCGRFRCASASRRRWRSRARCTSSRSCAWSRWRGSRRSARVYLAGVARRRAAARLRAVAGPRRRSVAGEARVRPERLRRHPVSARAGGVALCRAERRDAASIAARRSPARAARSTRRGRSRRCSSAACTSSCRLRLRPPAAARRARRGGDGRSAASPFLAGKYGAGVGAGTLDAAQQPRSRRDDRQRQPRLPRDGDRAVLDEDAGRRSRTGCRATWSSARPT